MHATATVHIPQEVHSLYHAHSAASFDPAPRLQPAARIHDVPAPHHRMPPPQQAHNQQPGPANAPAAASRVDKAGIPAMTSEGVVLVDEAESQSVRSYTPVKLVGDGSFGTVWLCDWHSTLPPNTPLSPMQCGAGARPDWVGKRLVALKRMKKPWAGGWPECRHLPELESLRLITRHPNIIPLYDYFLLPTTKELYFVFECMEGNLYQLIKSRKGRPLAGGLVSSIFSQVVSGLHHIHQSGYFHRDMKPENLLVTTTGLHNYPSTNPRAAQGAEERDVAVIVKLADFGLARLTSSSPPYTEYVSTRWYRAPEVLLRSRDYSNPVDMWALGTIMAELVNLRPLFPGQGEIDQVALICEILGDPSPAYGVDERGMARGGGDWARGVKLARDCGFAFPKTEPKLFESLFDDSVPRSLVECIADLLKYDPAARLTSTACVQHRYLVECKPYIPAVPHSLATAQPPVRSRNTHPPQQQPGATRGPLQSLPPRDVPPSHSYQSNGHPEQPHQRHPQYLPPQQPIASISTSPPVQPTLTTTAPAPPHLHIHQPQPIPMHHRHQLVNSPESLSPTSLSVLNTNVVPLTHASLNHLAIRSPARSDSVSIASPASTSAPLTASSSPMSPQLMASAPYAQQQAMGLGLGFSQMGQPGLPSRGGATSQLVDQLRDLDLPMDALTSFGQRHPNESRERQRGSPTKARPQQQQQMQSLPHEVQQQQPFPHQHSLWPQQDRQNGKRRGSDPDTDMAEGSRPQDDQSTHPSGKGFLGLVKKNKSWGLFGGGGDKNAPATLPPVEEVMDSTGSIGSLAQSHGSDDSSRRLLGGDPHLVGLNGEGLNGDHAHFPPVAQHASTSTGHLPQRQPTQDLQLPPMDEKKMRRELAKQRHAEKEEAQKARARAVTAKRERILNEKPELLDWGKPQPLMPPGPTFPMPPMPSSARRTNGVMIGNRNGVEALDSVGSTMKVMLPAVIQEEEGDEYQQMVEMEGSQQRSRKARRRDLDDDHSMSSADTRPRRRLSIATIDSDPGPVRPMPPQRLRERPSAMNMNRATSHSSLRSALSTGNSSLRGYSSSARSSTSLEQGFLEGFAQASVGTGHGPGPSGHVSLSPEMHSPHLHPYSRHPHHHHLPRPPQSSSSSLNLNPHSNSLPPMLTNSQHSSTITLPPISTISSPMSPHPGLNDKGSHETLHPKHSYYADVDMSSSQETHPMFTVPTIVSPQDVQMTHHPTGVYYDEKPSLPPFSEIASIADRGAEHDVGMGDAG